MCVFFLTQTPPSPLPPRTHPSRLVRGALCNNFNKCHRTKKKQCTLNLKTPTGFLETFLKEVLEVGEHFWDKATALLVQF